MGATVGLNRYVGTETNSPLLSKGRPKESGYSSIPCSRTRDEEMYWIL